MTVVLIIYVSLLISFTLAPFVKSDYWIFRICEYPRWQKLIFSVIAVIAMPVWMDHGNPVYIPFLIAMALNIIYLSALIWPYTVLGKKQVLHAGKVNTDERIKLVVFNVLQYNKNYKECLQQMKKVNADLIVLLETDQKWLDQFQELKKDYGFFVEVPLDNTYGMALFSKFELVDPKVKYIVEDDIPSVHSGVLLPGGRKVQLYAVHPCPPSPDINPRSTERDAELLKIADLAKASKDPVIVLGDLNDVAWSYTTKLFLKMSQLLDPRRGRGMFNTFNAKNPIFRFPLDHAFISPDFKLLELRRLKNYGSDHFPILVDIQYEENAENEQRPLKVKPEDRKLAREKKAKV